MRNPEAELHIVDSAIGRHLFVVDGSRIYDIDDRSLESVDALAALIEEIAPEQTRRIKDEPIAPPPLTSLSLNVAQMCNMGCSYCYADEGRFGGKRRLMPLEIAQRAVDRLIEESQPRREIVVGFIGGEPFLNRRLIHSIVPYAEDRAAKTGRHVRFSLTTNGTLIDRNDIKLLTRHDFQVTLSIDGPPIVNDKVRRLLGGEGSYSRVRRTIELFAEEGRPHHLSARATVTPLSGELVAVLDHLISLGFDSAGFGAVLVSPDPKFEFQAIDFDRFLEQMIHCGEMAKREILKRHPYPFSNFETALHELERGSHRPYPCGAGAGYLSVNADGEMFACHRLIDDPKFAFGTITAGSDPVRRADHLRARHVDQQEPCRDCWARYLCGGGCYHEVDRRGRIACEYIRGWLHWCIGAYAEIKETASGYFDDPLAYFEENRPAHEPAQVPPEDDPICRT
jgi:uncharacterized protein